MLDQSYSDAIWHRINQKTKPLGALGQLESLAHQLALIQSNLKCDAVTNVDIVKPTVIVFAGDHGIADEGVSIAPSAVTQQMVLNFLAGGAAINCFCRINQIELKVVDTGILIPVEVTAPNFVVQRLGDRTANFANEAAMSSEQVQQGIEFGRELVKRTVNEGCNLFMFGEMGIGNTSSAAAIVAALTGQDAQSCVGLGTGITPEQLAKKVALVDKGVSRCQGLDVYQVLSEVGGFEIVQMVGAFLAACETKMPVIVDGFIVTTAAYAASLIQPECREFMIFAHKSEELAHQLLLEELGAKPLLDLSMRLGEGTGAALAVPLVRAAAEFYNSMASFEDAGVTV
ncbi:nicotinate-nucleotide--dimethylbenzimidazole phosphoribosyltransferase [Vibrio coralliilyticus]|uniref:nicotinate-nucleotide--dimethylbenzimidazole phosphoribosyltransferase n=1 Tax=Vibrio coralliilyticus TaxID=190893 RepID=UPI001561A43F|nr:nicotinate-nucleotide--dimethylbenzimidazole phosphoribosyltransferase [Vibrio coralliilyticus]NRF28241.1 nicotinate-nucleotide--dimethylbenzimidazole phosphoribosyltransferase [Vibrio coralliilyticus]NRF51948.1 nicotinate-nucleotide--dimethylbenzimidazole phosphoribosyltransferase [Vibrio coralliilyticus]NRG05343.1 nicotinate-nucleotide--dimethylbenzimidazole phosphoribosyltransferase [Vibrio coralliilyticus]